MILFTFFLLKNNFNFNRITMCFFQTKTPAEMNEILHKSYNDLLMKRINCEMMSLKDNLFKKLDALQPESDDDQQ